MLSFAINVEHFLCNYYLFYFRYCNPLSRLLLYIGSCTLSVCPLSAGASSQSMQFQINKMMINFNIRFVKNVTFFHQNSSFLCSRRVDLGQSWRFPPQKHCPLREGFNNSPLQTGCTVIGPWRGQMVIYGITIKEQRELNGPFPKSFQSMEVCAVGIVFRPKIR